MEEDINKIKITMSIKDLQDIKEFNRKEAQKELLEKLKILLNTEYQASNFCGCWEGDIYGYYTDCCKKLINDLAKDTNKEDK